MWCCGERRDAPIAAALVPAVAIDARTPAEAEALLHRVCAPMDGLDAMMPRLIALYEAFEPREQDMRALSIAQQRLQGVGDHREFASTTVLLAMTASIVESSRRPSRKRLRRAQSVPTLRKRFSVPD